MKTSSQIAELGRLVSFLVGNPSPPPSDQLNRIEAKVDALINRIDQMDRVEADVAWIRKKLATARLLWLR